MEKITGKVKFFKSDKGYGFIQPDSDNQSDVFVHVTGLAGELKELHKDDKVKFSTVKGKKGLQAIDVEVVA